MKKYFIMFLSLFICFSVFSEPLEGFWESKFGDSKDSVVGMMKKRGWHITGRSENNCSFEKRNGTYGGIKPSHFGKILIEFEFYEGAFYEVTVGIVTSTIDAEKIMEVFTVLNDKFECKQITYDENYPIARGKERGLFVKSVSVNNNFLTFFTNATRKRDGICMGMFTFTDSSVQEKVNEKEEKKRQQKMQKIDEDL